MQQIEELIAKVENFEDPVARETSVSLVQALMDFHGAALERLMEIVAASAEGDVTLNRFAADDVVSNLLLLYGLHPLSIETRVRKALEQVRPYIESHGGSVELLGVHDGVVNLLMAGSCKSCPSSELTLKLAIEEAIYAAAPDVVKVQAESLVQQLQTRSTELVQIGKNENTNVVARSTA